MKFGELYEKGLDRKVNPAVSASDLSDDTVLTEITEYVFTQEIIVNLYKILTNIRMNEGSHVGIWINGYYGSGKSHFLKYASYCLASAPEHRDLAFMRLIDEAEDMLLHAPNNDLLEQAGVSVSELKALQNWYVNRATVEMVMFNIGDVHDANTSRQTTFTTIFWNQFNARRGYNSFNLALAQHLEKALDDDGKFQEFKQFVASKGYDWERNISRFAAGRLDLALQMAKEVDPALAIDVIRERIKTNDINISVDAFATEMKEYLDKKQNPNYRLLFFVDEVSQFIGQHRDLLLQLQSLVKRLDEVCENRIWIACTAQQSLEDVVSGVGAAANPNDEVGKILGRFEVRASLQGTSPEYITQRRILEKKGEVEIALKELYTKSKTKLDAQFILPSAYRAYSSHEDFAAYYPFVPYQFQLIMKVLDSFVNMNYVDKQVKGNERSLINITFSIAKETAQCELGEFVPFDAFFGAMFQGSMQHLGQRAMANARQAVDLVSDPKKQVFYRRVVNVLFMVCNLSDVDKPSFSATIDNIVTLLMTKVDASKAAIKSDVAEVLNYLDDKCVIRKETTPDDVDVYSFYTHEEAEVAEIIKNQPVDSNLYSEELRKILFKHFDFTTANNKENYCTRSFNVSGNVDGRAFFANNGDVTVDFFTTAQNDNPDQFAFTNRPEHLVFFLYPQLREDKDLRQMFLDYCRVQRFAQVPAVSDERQRTKRLFQDRAKDIYNKEIFPRFAYILDTCPVISGQNVLSAYEIGTAKKAERYKNAIARHMATLYDCAQLVNSSDMPRNQADLQAKILAPVDPHLVDLPLSNAERKVKDYLDRQPHDVTVSDVVRYFARVPYGWSDLATIYVLNELVRRHLYAFNYNNNPNVSREETARNIVREQSRFTVEPAKAISQEVLNQFIEAWKHIFNVMQVRGSNDSTELFRNCKEKDDSALRCLSQNYQDLLLKIAAYPFASVIKDALTMMDSWLALRDPKQFFEAITAARQDAAALFDRCKNINTFSHDQLANYRKVLDFLSENRDNFQFLPPEQQQAVRSLRQIAEDIEPWNNMPSYMKMMRMLSGRLGERKQALIEDIKAAYNRVFEELDEYAASVNVTKDKYANRENTISLKTTSNNFYALQAAADTAMFHEEQMRWINEAIPNGGSAPPRKFIHLNIRTQQPILSEADVDTYLASLKAQIMPHLSPNTEIVIS